MSLLKIQFYYLGLSIILLALIFMSLSAGTIHISFNNIFDLLQHHDSSVESIIMHTVRIPRTICAVLIGAALALSGVILFYIARNDLACPSLLGINQGVYLGITLSVVLGGSFAAGSLFACGIFFGTCAGLLTFFVTYKIGFSPIKLLLTGQAINLFCYAACQLLLIFFPGQADLLLTNLNGSLANSSWALLHSFALILVLAIMLTLVFIKRNYILSLGEEMAKSIGVNVRINLILFLAIMLVISTCSVAMVGPLLFFPLLAVQCSKLIISSNRPYHFAMISVLMGSILLLASDVLIRSLYHNWEAPLNVFVAMLGVPILIMRTRSMQ